MGRSDELRRRRGGISRTEASTSRTTGSFAWFATTPQGSNWDRFGPGEPPIGIGVDLDCNVWVANIAARQIAKFSPAGKLLATAASADLIAEDIAVGPKGDVYVSDHEESIVHFTEDHSKPRTAAVPKSAAASGPATFKIVLKTNGRPTTETRKVIVAVPAGVR